MHKWRFFAHGILLLLEIFNCSRNNSTKDLVFPIKNGQLRVPDHEGDLSELYL